MDTIEGRLRELGLALPTVRQPQGARITMRLAIGMAELPFDIPVEIETIVEIADAG